MTKQTPNVLRDVQAERARQHRKWGDQNHPNGTGHHQWLLHGRELGWPDERAPVTMGHLAHIARQVTDESAFLGTVTYADILLEEVGEAFAEDDPNRLRGELVQVAAVAVQWVEKIDRDQRRRSDDER